MPLIHSPAFTTGSFVITFISTRISFIGIEYAEPRHSFLE